MRMSVAAEWSKWREAASRSKAGVSQACIRSVTYGAETWTLIRKLMEVRRASDHRMLREMVGIRQQGRQQVFSVGVAGRIVEVLRRERL